MINGIAKIRDPKTGWPNLKWASPFYKMGHWGNLLIFNGKFVCKLPT